MMDSLFRRFNYFGEPHERSKPRIARSILVSVVLSLFISYQSPNQDDRHGSAWPIPGAGCSQASRTAQLGQLNGNLINRKHQTASRSNVRAHATSLDTVAKLLVLHEAARLSPASWDRAGLGRAQVRAGEGALADEQEWIIGSQVAKAANIALASNGLGPEVERAPDDLPINASAADNLENIEANTEAEFDSNSVNANDNETDKGANSSACEHTTIMMDRKPGLIASIFFSLCYATIFAMGLLGNTLTIYAMSRKREKAAIDTFIANLALSDIMLCIFAVPITPIYMLWLANWVFGFGMCKLFTFAMSASVYISTLTLISIAYLRYQLIVHPHEQSMTKFAAFRLNVCIWLLGFLITYPYLIHVKLLPTESCDIKFCGELWVDHVQRILFSVATVILQCCLPSSAITYFYRSIGKKLEHLQHERAGRMKTANGAAPHSTIGNGSASAHKKQLKRRSSLQDLAHLQLFAGHEGEPLATKMILVDAKVTGISHQSAARETETVLSLQADSSYSPAHQTGARLGRAASCLRVGASHPIKELSHLHEDASQSASADDILVLRERRLRERDKRHKQTSRKLIKMVSFFVVSWLPLNLFNLAQDYFDSLGEWEYTKHVFLVVHVIACSSVCCNPILYAWMSDNYRQELQDILPRFLFPAANWLTSKLST